MNCYNSPFGCLPQKPTEKTIYTPVNTCFSPGKDAEQASGIATIEQTVDAPITDSRLIVMERMMVLLSR